MSSRTYPSRTPAPRSRDEDQYGRASPLPSYNSRVPSRSQARTRDRAGDSRTVSSSSSSTTASSPFLDRMRANTGSGEQPKRAWASSRSRRQVEVEEDEFDERDSNQDSDSTRQAGGYGYDLWTRVTAVAGNLTVNVSKAWEQGITTFDGEETPPGQESRLTKAMKAYHLERARSPADLPAWLFDESERRTTSRSWGASKRDEYEDRFLPESEPRQRGGLRDVYKAAAASSPSVPPSRRVNEGSEVSGATNRLKAIREAKRSAARPTADVPRAEDRYQNAERQSPRPQRVGLPPRPGRIRQER